MVDEVLTETTNITLCNLFFGFPSFLLFVFAFYFLCKIFASLDFHCCVDLFRLYFIVKIRIFKPTSIGLNLNFISITDGNPVTGQGYITEINTAVPALNGSKPALNGTKQVINKNRIPPGGFSSGLW